MFVGNQKFNQNLLCVGVVIGNNNESIHQQKREIGESGEPCAIKEDRRLTIIRNVKSIHILGSIELFFGSNFTVYIEEILFNNSHTAINTTTSNSTIYGYIIFVHLQNYYLK